MTATVSLQTPIARGDTSIATLQLRKPTAGELRGVKLLDLAQLDVQAVITVLPRISIPTLTDVEAAALDPADLMQCATEIGRFLLKKDAADSQP